VHVNTYGGLCMKAHVLWVHVCTQGYPNVFVCVCVCNCMGTNKSVNEPLMSCNHTHTAVLF